MAAAAKTIVPADQAAAAARCLSDSVRESLASTDASTTPAGSQAALSTIANLLKARQELDAAKSPTAAGHAATQGGRYMHQGKLAGTSDTDAQSSTAGGAPAQSDLSGNTIATTLAGAAAITPTAVSFVSATRSYQSAVVNAISNSTLSFST